jgi:hypothetical protein
MTSKASPKSALGIETAAFFGCHPERRRRAAKKTTVHSPFKRPYLNFLFLRSIIRYKILFSPNKPITNIKNEF